MGLKEISKKQEGLEKELADLENKELKLKREKMRDEGSMADSLEDLVCKIHPDSRFIEVEDRSFSRTPIKRVVCYSCAEESLEKLERSKGSNKYTRRLNKLKEDEEFDIRWPIETKAYLCDSKVPIPESNSAQEFCGWVLGSPSHEIHQSYSSMVWMDSMGTENHVYSCRICDAYLGSRQLLKNNIF